MSRPDRGGLPLNVDAAPFVPGGGGGGGGDVLTGPVMDGNDNVWKLQAERLSGGIMAGIPSMPTPPGVVPTMPTPPLSYGTPPTSAGMRTPLAAPMSAQLGPGPIPPQRGTPLTEPKQSILCPSGHGMRHCQGNQVVNQDGRLVSVGGVFCRLCDSESLEGHTQGYYSCQECHWDCCILCAATQQSHVPPMSLGLHAHHKHILATAEKSEANSSQDVIKSIRYHLQLLSDEEPCGLSSMPLDKLKIYDNYLKGEIAKKKSTVQKVSVTRAEEEVPAAVPRKKKPAEAKTLKFSVNDKIQFVGGGRFSGNKRWKDGAKLTIGDYGLVKEIDTKENFLYKCQFDNVYVKLSEADIIMAKRKQPVAEKPATVTTPREDSSNSNNNTNNNNNKEPVKEPSASASQSADCSNNNEDSTPPVKETEAEKEKEILTEPTDYTASKPSKSEASAPTATATATPTSPAQKTVEKDSPSRSSNSTPLIVTAVTLLFSAWFFFRKRSSRR